MYFKGHTVSHYEIHELIGKGAMGEVYRASDRRLGREVAVKFLSGSTLHQKPNAVRRFQREARAVALINHPNICTLFDVGNYEDSPYLVMELLQGETLDRRIEQGTLSMEEILDWSVQIADALEAAHTQRLIHRDIKPGNLWITQRGEMKVLDFGLVLQNPITDSIHLEEEPSTGDAGLTVGTIAYMSPEQAMGEKIDPRTDLFSFGGVLYEMLTGDAPFGKQSFGPIITSILNRQPTPPREIRADVPEELERILFKCLEKKPDARYPSAGDLLHDLKKLRRYEILKQEFPPDPQPPAAPPDQKRWQVLGVLSTLLLCVLLILIGHVVLDREILPSLSTSPSSDPAPDAVFAPRVIPLTSDGGYKSTPHLSPAGDRVAYSRDPGGFAFNQSTDLHAGDVYVKDLRPGSSAFRLTDHPLPEGHPVWSPDGSEIAFLRFTKAKREVYVIPAFGGKERKIFDLEGSMEFYGYLNSLHWSVDGSTFVASEIHQEGTPAYVVRYSLETGKKEVLTTPPQGSMGDFSPALTDDGKILAFSRSASKNWGNHDLWIQSPVEGGAPRRLTFEHYNFVHSLAWSESGEILYFSDPTESVFQVDLEGRVQPILGVGLHAADVTVRGDRMVYRQETPNEYDLVEIPLGEAIRRGQKVEARKVITSSGADINPDFSPDMRRLAFGSNRRGSQDIWVSDLDGRNAVQRTFHDSHAGTARWSPDGQTLVYDTLETDNWDLYLIDADKGPPRRLTDEPTEEGTGTWSQDGRWIYHHSNRGGTTEIWKISPESGEIRPVTSGGGFYGRESQDGRFFYYIRSWAGSGIWRMPTEGGEAIRLLPGPIKWSEWALGVDGLYFAEEKALGDHNGYAISRYDLKTGEIQKIYQDDGARDHLWLAVAPDESRLLFGQKPYRRAELILMDGFH